MTRCAHVVASLALLALAPGAISPPAEDLHLRWKFHPDDVLRMY